ncbi:MAG: exodeoxyribonuclease VII large subunit [Phycisphaerales bacterium]|nr:exodeoxyribonuclease VII large subunit [Planctomycetota bacterium]MCH8507800.1 exodeoxyribonuclease VII large subunit [Phycisphaerales bacterium]
MSGRLPFDPGRIKRGKRAGPGGETPPGLVVPGDGALPEGVLTITQLAVRIDAALKSGVPGRVRVVGEVSNVSSRTHWYFSLKDEGAVVSAVAFASTARKLRVLPTQGERVIATGRLDYYAPGGRVSLIIDELEPLGQGALERELKARVEMLRERGWLDPETKRPLPAFPRTIAVVTSKDGAAVQDVIDTARRRCPAVALLIVDVRVQGERAAPDVSEAVRLLSATAHRLGIDAILVTRGGGSLEDLWAFNEITVAEAIRNTAVPVVAAIGHETDTTIAELVADHRAATPTQAVMALIPDAGALQEQLDALARRVSTAARQHAIAERKRLSMLAGRPAFRDPARVLDAHRDRLGSLTRQLAAGARTAAMQAERRLHRAAARLERHRPGVIQARREEALRALEDRLDRAVRTRARAAADTLDALHRELHAVGPLQVLARGFSVTTTPDGRLLRAAGEVTAGDEILTRLQSGTIRSGVLGPGDTTPAPPRPADRPPPRRRRKAPPPDDRQMGLF